MRGQKSETGAERLAPNGYRYIKQEDGSWKLKHWIVAETTLGRPVDPGVERVKFLDGKRDNFDPKNIKVVPKGRSSVRRRMAQIESRIAELQAEHAILKSELESGKV
jgi:hypothetical protein